MKKTGFIIITLFLSTWLQAQQLVTKDQQQVQQTVINFFESLSNRDSISLKNCSTHDIVLFENGKIWNADTLILKTMILNTATDFKRINTIDFINTIINKSTAWSTYNLHSEITRNGKQTTVQWMETVVLIKDKKQWKINVLHSTRLPKN